MRQMLDTATTTERDADTLDVAGSTDPDPQARPVRAPRRGRLAMIVALVVAAALVAGIVRWRSDTGAVGTDYRLTTVGTGAVVETVALNGTVRAAQRAEVNFALAGTVDSVSVTAGQTVVAGQPLATLQTGSLQAAVKQAQATLDLANEKLFADIAAQIAASTTTTTASTTTTVAADPNAATAAQLARTPSAAASTPQVEAVPQVESGPQATAKVPTEADISSDQAAIYEAQIALKDANEQLALATVTSPIDGKVMSVGVASRDSVAAGTTTETSSADVTESAATSTSAQFAIEDTSGYSVVGTLPASSMSNLAVGNPTTVVATSSARQLAGVVTAINRIPTTSNGTATFTVSVAVTTPGVTLYSGTNASATITVQHREGVMVVPTSALHTTGDATTVDVFDAASGAVDHKVTRSVKLGAVGSTTAEILSGLRLGDRVVLADVSAAIPTSNSTTGSSSTAARRFQNRFGATGGFGG